MSEPVIIGNATLYLGDCRKILPTLPKVDAVVTDPPYGVSRDKGMGLGGWGLTGNRTNCLRRYDGDWDSSRPESSTITALLDAADLHIVWGGQFFADVLPVQGKWLFWDKCQTMPSFGDGELAWTSLPGNAVKQFTYNGSGLHAKKKDRVHPTQKPLRLMKWCIEQLPANAHTILDPYMGSGTTGVACAQMGRAFIGCEIDPRYFDIACKRIEQAQRQSDMFIEPKPAPRAEQVSLFDAA
jgi:site-specific DNA-methyltransferase (adenine-specific)/modification methylase